jgi:3alpha(or 20beta)-hydroxysteroid dehydrogenase
MGRLEGKVVLVTGAARGQGEAEARLFVEEGAHVVLGDVLDAEGKAVAESLGEFGLYQHLDVTSSDDWENAVAATIERFGKIDGLVNNAGILLAKPLLEMDVDDYRRVIDVNLVGCFLGIQTVGRALRDSGGGSMVNISSTAGFKAVPTASAYVSSKFGMRGLTRTAALELGRYHIRVNSIHPGGVDTEMVRALRSPSADADSEGGGFHTKLPLGRIGQPIEIARLALFLLSDDASYCTGSEFVADGGLLA